MPFNFFIIVLSVLVTMIKIYFLVPNRIQSILTFISQYYTICLILIATNSQGSMSGRHSASQLFSYFLPFLSLFSLARVTTGQVALLFDFAAFHREFDAMFIESINQRRASEGCGWSQNAATEIEV